MDMHTEIHASCVALDGRGLLILGPSGSGKSALALELMALGARLVADDRVLLSAEDGRLVARCPPTIAGLIEARGFGVLNAEALEAAEIALAIDLGTVETERVPPRRSVTMLGIDLALVHRPESQHFTAALLHYLRSGRSSR